MTGTSRAAYLATALSVVVGLGMVVSAARADAPVTDGLICRYTQIPDPWPAPGTERGRLEGGPVRFTEAPEGTTPQQGTLFCRVQVVDAFTSDHNGSGPTVTGHTNADGLATAGPADITINRSGTQNVFLCSEFHDDASGVTYYWDGDLSEWSTLSTVHCEISITGDDGSGPSDLEILIGSIVCPVLKLVFPPEGDVLSGTWDCPPYGDNGPGPTISPLPSPDPLPTLTPPTVTPPPGPLLGCDDGLDNDGDGVADFPDDPGCDGPSDTDEHGWRACDDGTDNDGDGEADYPADAGCSSPTDTDESGGPPCDDGVDNDGDGATDFGSDIGCTSSTDASEHDATFVCDNGLDDDGDGYADYPRDTGCSNAADPNERTIP